MGVTLEICVDDAAGVAAAVAGGADRLELCADLAIGGLTPSAALISHGVKSGLPVHVLVRPRAGDFVLQEDEEALMIVDIKEALSRGAAGVVTGALLPDGRLDSEALARFRDAVRDGVAVLHRAIDLTCDPAAAVVEAGRLGYHKVLSSGGAASAAEGAATLARMVTAAGDRLSVIAGGGVRPENVAALVAATGVREVHGSAGSPGPETAEKLQRLGFASRESRRTDPAVVAALRSRLERWENDHDG